MSLLTYVILIVFCVIRNVEMYPTNQGEYTIDMQAYIYWFENGLAPKWEWKRILTFNQSEPLFFTINLVIRKFTSNYRVYWFVLYSIYIGCFLHFIKRTFRRT